MAMIVAERRVRLAGMSSGAVSTMTGLLYRRISASGNATSSRHHVTIKLLCGEIAWRDGVTPSLEASVSPLNLVRDCTCPHHSEAAQLRYSFACPFIDR